MRVWEFCGSVCLWEGMCGSEEKKRNRGGGLVEGWEEANGKKRARSRQAVPTGDSIGRSRTEKTRAWGALGSTKCAR